MFVIQYVYLITNSKTVPCLTPIHKEGNEPCFIYRIKYGCYFYLLHTFLFFYFLSKSNSYNSLHLFSHKVIYEVQYKALYLDLHLFSHKVIYEVQYKAQCNFISTFFVKTVKYFCFIFQAAAIFNSAFGSFLVCI